MRLDLTNEIPKLMLSAADERVITKYQSLMGKVAKYMPELPAEESLMSLATVIDATKDRVFSDEPQVIQEAPVTAG